MLVVQSCLTLLYPVVCSPPGSSVRGILQARIVEWVAILFSRGIFPTQWCNPGLLRWLLSRLSHQGSPKKNPSAPHLWQNHLLGQMPGENGEIQDSYHQQNFLKNKQFIRCNVFRRKMQLFSELNSKRLKEPKVWAENSVSANSTRSGQAVGTRDPFHQELMVVVLSFPRLPTHTTVGSWSHLTVGSWSQSGSTPKNPQLLPVCSRLQALAPRLVPPAPHNPRVSLFLPL